MRRILIALLLCTGLLVLAGCGNKGPLVRPPASPASPATPAPTSAPAAAASVPPSNTPSYLSPRMPVDTSGAMP